jgi:probable F420-dependent oxidoreductase
VSAAESALIYVSASHRPAPELIEIARIGEELGFDGMSMADHVFVPTGRLSGYPYSSDGQPPFEATTVWTDVLLVATAAAAQTSRLRFATCVYILPLRHPLIVARAVASLEAIAPGRVQLGVGVGWLRAEFDTLGVDYSRRGELTDESIAVLRKLWAGGLVEHDGPNYPLGQLYFEPHPSQPVPILVGGMSARALTRAAKLGDGCIAMPTSTDGLLEMVAQVRMLRASFDRLSAPFLFHAWSDDSRSVDDYRRLIEAGVNTFYVPAIGPLDEVRARFERFLTRTAEPLRASGHLSS